MQALVCPFCSGVVETDESSAFGKCKYCRRTFSVKNAHDMAAASNADRENVVKWRKELMSNLDIVERSQKRRDYSNVKHFALKILSILPNDPQSRYFCALCDYKSGNDAPYIDYLKNHSTDGASNEEIEFISSKIIDYAEKKHEKFIFDYFTNVFVASAKPYILRAQNAIAEQIRHLRLTGVRDCDVFICHSSVDEAEARRLTEALEREELTCWIAERNLLPGTQNYDEELESAVEHCRMMLFLSSASSVYSKECEKELRIANAEGKLFFAVKLDNEPYYGVVKNILGSVQWLNAFDGVIVHGDEIATAVKAVFADDEKEKAELERRALEARKRVESAKSTVIVQAAARGGAIDNSDVYLTQIEAWAANAESALGDLDKGNSLVDKGLAENPQNAELWLWKHIVTAAEGLRDKPMALLPASEWDKRYNAAHNEVAQAMYGKYADFINQMEISYKQADGFGSVGVNCAMYDLTRNRIKEALGGHCDTENIKRSIEAFKGGVAVDRRGVSLSAFVLERAAVYDRALLSGIYADKAESFGGDKMAERLNGLRASVESNFIAVVDKADSKIATLKELAIRDSCARFENYLCGKCKAASRVLRQWKDNYEAEAKENERAAYSDYLQRVEDIKKQNEKIEKQNEEIKEKRLEKRNIKTSLVILPIFIVAIIIGIVILINHGMFVPIISLIVFGLIFFIVWILCIKKYRDWSYIPSKKEFEPIPEYMPPSSAVYEMGYKRMTADRSKFYEALRELVNRFAEATGTSIELDPLE